MPQSCAGIRTPSMWILGQNAAKNTLGNLSQWNLDRRFFSASVAYIASLHPQTCYSCFPRTNQNWLSPCGHGRASSSSFCSCSFGKGFDLEPSYKRRMNGTPPTLIILTRSYGMLYVKALPPTDRLRVRPLTSGWSSNPSLSTATIFKTRPLFPLCGKWADRQSPPVIFLYLLLEAPNNPNDDAAIHAWLQHHPRPERIIGQ